MITSTFRIDLGQGDYVEISFHKKEEFTLNELLTEIKKSGEWFVSGVTAIQTIHIKRIEALNS